MPASETSFSFGLLSSRGRTAGASMTIAAASAQEEEEEEDDAEATKTIVAKSDCRTAGSEKRMTTTTTIVEVRSERRRSKLARWARIQNYEVGHDVVVVAVVFYVRLRFLDANQRSGRTDDSRPSYY